MTSMDISLFSLMAIVAVFVALGIFLLIRSFWLWFWRIDHAINRLDSIIANQNEQLEVMRSLVAQNRTMIDQGRQNGNQQPVQQTKATTTENS
jgi:hypothetical protein